ncbi:MAG: pentapeptide repeat-containing protein [Lachnospiraceae bacterium]|nr:pentapeptide repeat-containing protein [Lachnospiraceae bacterium]
MNGLHNTNTNSLKNMKADCAHCSGLCCTALFFSKVDGFPEDKMAGKPCMNLEKDFRCRIHDKLAERHMRGCIGYDCFGAGQHVTQVIYKGETWQNYSNADEIFNVFTIVFQLYQVRYYLEEAVILIEKSPLKTDIQICLEKLTDLCLGTLEEIQTIKTEECREQANQLLKRVIALQQESIQQRNTQQKNIQQSKVPERAIKQELEKYHGDFLGKNLKGRNLSGCDFSTALLIAANLKSCICEGTIFLGADTRDTNFCDADLRRALFLTQGQINAAKGNRHTKLPDYLEKPVTWK